MNGNTELFDLASLLAEHPAKRSLSPDCEKAWLTTVATLPLRSCVSFTSLLPSGLFGKTCPVSYPIEQMLSVNSAPEWGNSGMGGPTGCLTLNSSESRSDAVECSLWDIVEAIGDVPQEYYLTAQELSTLLLDRARHPKSLRIAWRQADSEGVNRATASPTSMMDDLSECPL